MSQNTRERLFLICSCFLFLFDFNDFPVKLSKSDIHTCWPHFQNCRDFFPEYAPGNYGQSILFMLIFGLIIACIYFLFKNNEKIYLGIFSSLVVTKIFIYFFLVFTEHHNFAYFHILPAIAFLINTRNRLFGAQVTWAVVYSLSAVVKLDESWILGTYFTPLELGMPLVPRELIPIVSFSVILVELIAGWTLLSVKFRKISVGIWTVFHTYSVILVGFFYPTRCIANLWSLFLGTQTEERPKVLNNLTIAFFTFLGLMQVAHYAFPEEPRVTMRLEGYGFNMFDANFQCYIEITQQSSEGLLKQEYIKKMSMHRCSPRKYLDIAKSKCNTFNSNPIMFTMVKSINGGPFYEIVKVADACSTQFSLVGENNWINHRNPPLIGYPAYNRTRESDPKTKEDLIFQEQIIRPVYLQKLLRPIYPYLRIGLLILWMISTIFIIFIYFRNKNEIRSAKFRSLISKK